jgi:acyl carrier protein
MNEVDEVLTSVLRDAVQYTDPIHDDLTLSSIPEWDSLAHVLIMSALEAQTEEMIEMTSVGAIRKVLARYGVGSCPTGSPS